MTILIVSLGMTDGEVNNVDLSNGAIICSHRKERDAWISHFLDRLGTQAHVFDAVDSDVTGKRNIRASENKDSTFPQRTFGGHSESRSKSCSLQESRR